jgi:hypothetical protein
VVVAKRRSSVIGDDEPGTPAEPPAPPAPAADEPTSGEPVTTPASDTPGTTQQFETAPPPSSTQQ